MRILWATLLGSFLLSATTWETDFEKAKQSAKTEHKLILLNFSGSDWCGPCIRMRKQIFESPAFTQYAGDHLILVNADFPQMKKNELTKAQQAKNDKLADIYNKDGIFPQTVLLTSDGKVLKEWKGLPRLSADEFTGQLKTAVDASK
jgi:thioredoxin-related protein